MAAPQSTVSGPALPEREGVIVTNLSCHLNHFFQRNRWDLKLNIRGLNWGSHRQVFRVQFEFPVGGHKMPNLA